MPRMFDILRGVTEENKTGDQKEKEAPAEPSKGEGKDNPPVAQPLSFPKQIINIGTKEEKGWEDHSLISKKLISAVRQHGVDDQEKADQIYQNAVLTVETLLAKIRAGDELISYMGNVYELLNNLFNQIVMGDNILNNIYDNPEVGYHLPYHIVNVLVLSSILAINMGFNKSRLSHIGLSSIFCDVGMDSLKDIAGQPRALTDSELKLIRGHISKSLETVERIANINYTVKQTIRMHHERVSGNGYPSGIFTDDINPYARILGLVDTYEAMTHNRPHREGMNSHKAVRFLIGSLKGDFDSDVLKIFINKMSVYPIGSTVMLDTGEMAKVISVQPGSPLRPVVMILRGANGENITERTIIDLSKQDVPSIKSSVSP